MSKFEPKPTDFIGRKPVPEYSSLPAIVESFSWLSPEMYKEVDSSNPHKAVMKGLAVKSGTVSKNKRAYILEELKRGARTFEKCPFTINHAPIDEEDAKLKREPFDRLKIIGNVNFMECDDDGQMEYVVTVSREPWVHMIKARDPSIKGVSIEANFTHLTCTQRGCGKKFYSEQEWKKHMIDDHFIHNGDGVKEVHGMRGKALSLVVSPEEPGVPNTTFDLMELYEKPVLHLLESICMDREGLRPATDGRGNYFEDEDGNVMMVNKEGRIVENEKKVVETVKAEKMVLGEPFAGYTSFDDCVAKNADKNDAKAYCASIERKTKEIEGTDPARLFEALRATLTEPDQLVLDAIIKVADSNIAKSKNAQAMAEIKARDAEAKMNVLERRNAITYDALQSEKQLTAGRVNAAKETYEGRLADAEKLEATNKGLTETNLRLSIENDNLRARVKPEFKGKAKNAVHSQEEPQNPLTNRG